MAEFRERTSLDGTPDVLVVVGEVDLSAADALVQHASAMLVAAGAGLVLDLSGVTFLDSSGLGALVRVRNEAVARGCTVRLSGATRQVVRLLQITGLADAFAVGHAPPVRERSSQG